MTNSLPSGSNALIGFAEPSLFFPFVSPIISLSEGYFHGAFTYFHDGHTAMSQLNIDCGYAVTARTPPFECSIGGVDTYLLSVSSTLNDHSSVGSLDEQSSGRHPSHAINDTLCLRLLVNPTECSRGCF